MRLSLISDEGDVLHVACEGDIQQQDFRPGRDPIEDVIGPSGYSRRVLLDMERTTYLESSGISWLLICHKHFVEAGGRLILHSVPPRVFRVLQIVHLPKILNIAPDEAGARALAGGGEGS